MVKLADKKKEYAREVIIETAKTLFSEKGYHHTQIMDIVRAVGMSAGTFYKHFKDKRELFDHIIRVSFEDFRALIKNVRKDVNAWDRAERLERTIVTITAYIDYIDRERQQFLFLLRGAYGVDADFDVNVWSYYSDITQDIANDYQEWIEKGVFEKTNSYALACVISGMTINVGHSYVTENRFTREEAIDVLTHGITAIFDAQLTGAAKQYESKASDSRQSQWTDQGIPRQQVVDYDKGGFRT